MTNDTPPLGRAATPPPGAVPPDAPAVVIVDQDAGVTAALAEMLLDNGIGATAVASTHALLDHHRLHRCDVVILDMAACGDGGLSVMRSLTDGQRSPAIIVMTRLATEVDRIVALEMGADDCVARPISPREMLARVRAVLRRRNRLSRDGVRPIASTALPPVEVACFAGWAFDVRSRRLVSPAGEPVPLTNGEFGMLATFVTAPQTVHSREELVRAYGREWGNPHDRSIDVNLSRLRRKLALHARDELIRTVRNGGYLFVPMVHYRRPGETALAN
ncbi:response regulator transcription factor [Sphingomonas kyungheensis]|uniref:Response regulator transcription factor n=1 Tax=Sphingomonas kyungheensis TaxID=1069987 RepID=A0ABU8H6H3_9SPHN